MKTLSVWLLSIVATSPGFFPKDFQMEKDMPIPSPLTSHTVLEDPDDAPKADFSRLFTQEHLQNIHSSYFGPKGISEKTLREHPLHRAILRLIPKDGTFPLKTQAEPAVMLSALGTYRANIKTMWKGTGIFTKSLNNLLTVLLKVHLAPKKHKNFQEFVKSLQNKKLNVNPRKITRDKKRNTFRVQEYKRMKYLRKANISNDPNIKDKYQKLVDRCDKRIEFYKKTDIDMDEAEPIVNESPVLHESIGEEQLLESTADSEEDTLSGDISGRRTKSLVSVMRSLLFSRKVTYTSHDLKTKMS
ncbi:hypothetical protein K501DRAFT_280286, partial [Backusella circina FSU 941]